MESAVEAILIREGQLQPQSQRNDVIPRRDNHQIERPRHYGSNLSVPIDYSNVRPSSRVNSQQYRDPPRRDPKKYRGTLCQLPNDFLRPPSSYRSQHINDEELALMLQNELFQREAFAALGSDMRGIQPSGQYRNRENMSSAYGNRAQSPHSEGIPDMGILKGLSKMSAAAKAKLSELAERFQESSSGGSGSGSSFGFNRNKVQVVNERDRETEMRRLMDNDDDEVIDFGSSNESRGQHTLNETRHNTYRKKDD